MLRGLPLDITCRVLEYISLDEIAEVLHQQPGIFSDPGTAEAVCYRVSKSHIVVNNRRQLPMVLEDYTPEFFSDRDSESVDPENLPILLKIARTEKYITISSVIWSSLDMNDMLQLISDLPEGYRYCVEIEFEPSAPHVYDLSMIVDKIHNCLGSTLKALSVRNFQGELRLNMHKLKALEALSLINTNVQFTTLFDQNEALKRFTLHPNCDGFAGNNIAELNQSLPLSLETLRLGQAVVVSPSPEYGAPRGVKDLTLSIVKDTTGKLLKQIIENSTVPRESFSYQSGLAECSVHANYDHISWILQRENRLTKVGLTSIKHDTGIWDLRPYEQLKSISIAKSNIASIQLPHRTVHLNLAGNNIKNITEALRNLPKGLLTLDVSNNPLEWDYLYGKLRFPAQLQELKLASCNIGDKIGQFVFPKCLQHLNLEQNRIRSLEGVELPESSSPLVLLLAFNNLRSLHNIRFPQNTSKLMLCENELHGSMDFSVDRHGNSTSIQWLSLCNNPIEDLSRVCLPHQLRFFEADRCHLTRFENVFLPRTIKEIHISGCGISYVRNIRFEEDTELAHIDLSHNRLDAECIANLQLPSSTRSILLENNKIGNLDRNYLMQFPSLRSFSIASNKLRRAHIMVPKTVRSLNLCKNKIRSIQLEFPKKSDSQLATINISWNHIEKLTPTMLGHGVQGTYLSNLFEIDGSGNPLVGYCSYETCTLSTFPQSLSCVFLKGVGLTDRYGYEIGANVMSRGYCMGKRLEI